MNKSTAIVLLVLVAILPACSTSGSATNSKSEDETSKPEVREISLMTGDEVTYTTGNGRSDVWTFRRDGTAEMRSDITEKFVRQAAVIKRARLSNDQFERLEKVINENGFFDKKESEKPVADAWRNLKVVTSAGEKTIQTFGGDDDPDISTMIRAITSLASELQWENAK
jgi:hypothetical protein